MIFRGNQSPTLYVRWFYWAHVFSCAFDLYFYSLVGKYSLNRFPRDVIKISAWTMRDLFIAQSLKCFMLRRPFFIYLLFLFKFWEKAHRLWASNHFIFMVKEFLEGLYFIPIWLLAAIFWSKVKAYIVIFTNYNCKRFDLYTMYHFFDNYNGPKNLVSRTRTRTRDACISWIFLTNCLWNGSRR